MVNAPQNCMSLIALNISCYEQIGMNEHHNDFKKMVLKVYESNVNLLRFMLVIVCIAFFPLQMWISFSPVADYTAEYYSISAIKVNWLSMTFMVVSIPIGLFSTWFLDGVGIRASVSMIMWI